MKQKCGAPTILILLFGALLFAASSAMAAEIFAAPAGNDANPGTKERPFATLERAREEARKVKGSGAITVWLRGGLYELPRGFKLEAQDGGTSEAPVTWRAFEHETPVLAGGRAITGFTKDRGEILKADVSAQGFKGIAFRQLVFDGRRQHLARYPNFDPKNPYGGGWAYVDGKLLPMYADIPGEDRHSLTCKAADLRAWARPEELNVFVFPRYNWWNNICPVKSIDRATRRITLGQDASYPIRPGDRYYLENALEELDAPGEWWLDKRAGMLYFWPPAPLEGRTVMAPTTGTVIEIDGADSITLRGLTVECSEGTAVVLRDTKHCRVAGCTIRNAGYYNGSGVAISGGLQNGVVGCDIHDTGSSAIGIDGGDRIKLAAAENYADNNYLHHFGIYYKQGVGVSLRGVGNRAAHNLIHDGPRMGIQFAGNNLLIEYNHIRHVNLETEDTGAVYTGGRDWLGSRGTIIRYNYFHDMLGYGHDAKGVWHSPFFAWGVYLDDNTGGVDVIGNLVLRCPRAGLHLHNGRDNKVENNIFAESTLQQIEFSGWTLTHRYWTTHLPTMIEGYESVMNEPAWRGMRNMNIHPKDAVLPDGTIMSGNEIVRNIMDYREPAAKYVQLRNFSFEHNRVDENVVWHHGQPLLTGQFASGKDEWGAWQAKGMDRKSVVADPLFENPAKDDYRLKADSPALKLGFKALPLEKIGPYQDELRASWPIVEAEGAREKPLAP